MDDRILQFAQTKVPADWQSRSLEERLAYWREPNDPAVLRRSICMAEVWLECLQRDISEYSQSDARKISKILSTLPGYRLSNSADCGPYGRQRAYVIDKPGLPKHWRKLASLSK